MAALTIVIFKMQEIQSSRNQIAVTVLSYTCWLRHLYPFASATRFLSDDYDSLYRIYIEKRILYREFLGR